MLLTKRIHESRVTKVTNTPTAPNYPRHHHPSFAANIRYDFPPPPVSISPTLPLPPFIPLYPYHVAASSTLSLPYLPFSHHALFLAPTRTPDRVSSNPQESSSSLAFSRGPPRRVASVVPDVCQRRRGGRHHHHCRARRCRVLRGTYKSPGVCRRQIIANPSRRECKDIVGWWTRRPARATMKVPRARDAPTR